MFKYRTPPITSVSGTDIVSHDQQNCTHGIWIFEKNKTKQNKTAYETKTRLISHSYVFTYLKTKKFSFRNGQNIPSHASATYTKFHIFPATIENLKSTLQHINWIRRAPIQDTLYHKTIIYTVKQKQKYGSTSFERPLKTMIYFYQRNHVTLPKYQPNSISRPRRKWEGERLTLHPSHEI